MAEEKKGITGKKAALYVTLTVITFLLLWWWLKPGAEERMAEDGEPEEESGSGGGGGGGSYPDVPTDFTPGGVKTLPATYRQPSSPTVTRSSAVAVSASQPLRVKGFTPKVQIPAETQSTTQGGGGGGTTANALTGGGVSVGLTTGGSGSHQQTSQTTVGGKNLGTVQKASSLNLSTGGTIMVK